MEIEGEKWCIFVVEKRSENCYDCMVSIYRTIYLMLQTDMVIWQMISFLCLVLSLNQPDLFAESIKPCVK